MVTAGKTKNEKEGQKIYNDWFSGNRSGYCLGLQVVKILAKTNKVDDMVNWKEAEFTKNIRDTLDYIAHQ